jgi:protoporphyrinogen oxidase
MKKKIIILGAGLSGLAAGEKLSAHFDVKIFEVSDFLGGLAATFEQDGRKIPRFYHHIIKSNSFTLDYLRRFYTNERLDWKRIKMAIGVGKKVYTINSLGLFKFNYLTWLEKFYFGLFGIYCILFMNPDKIPESMDAEAWLNKYAGKTITQKIFLPLYARNKFNIPLNSISAKQFANRLHEKEFQDFFMYPKEGYQCIIDGLRDKIQENDGLIKLNSKVNKIDLKEKYIMESGKKIKYDVLLSTIPMPIFTKLSSGLPEDLKENISKIKYCPAVSICFGTKEFLDKKHYWINLFNERIHIIMQHSLLCDNYKEKINWCLRYGGSEEDLTLSDTEIKEKYLGVVKRYFPNVKIKWAKVIRAKYAEPIYDIDYYRYVPDYKTSVEGLYFSGIQLTFPKIRNMNVALESGIKVAEIIINDAKIT